MSDNELIIIESPARGKKRASAPRKGKGVRTGRKSTKKSSKRDICRKWGVPEYVRTQNLRYQNPIEKGILWHFFSLKIRKRDVEKYGTCISCGRAITVETCDAGHFCPAGSSGRDLLFNERNVNAECRQCNAWDDMHLFGYQKGLDKRYGNGTAHTLLKLRKKYQTGTTQKEWKKEIYEQKLASITL